jgi:integrase
LVVGQFPSPQGLAQELWAARKAARRDDGESSYVFQRADRKPLDRYSPYVAVKGAARRAGVPWAGLHTLRHTCATELFNGGLNAKQVQVWLGRHSAAFTLATYVHLLSEDLPDADFLDELCPSEGVNEWSTRPTETSRDFSEAGIASSSG